MMQKTLEGAGFEPGASIPDMGFPFTVGENGHIGSHIPCGEEKVMRDPLSIEYVQIGL